MANYINKGEGRLSQIFVSSLSGTEGYRVVNRAGAEMIAPAGLLDHAIMLAQSAADQRVGEWRLTQAINRT
ncbi:hypothetical protein [Bradyrhizobium sp. SBR1B]|uniref:hypothetical protein n=1 Tax=Bradyrhizobium sp. SBR1B TaxID=2663836 RepID=UPI001606C00B|nr:hypothetical protein [Bradyrhizobium sp. SBR1B]MBB4380282.1 hypothetical protein [Bradyrhizobium sp. SBR1B]